jgi:hypothetical protein
MKAKANRYSLFNILENTLQNSSKLLFNFLMCFLNLHGFLFLLLFQRKFTYIVFEIVILVISISYSNLSVIFEFVLQSNCYPSVSYWYLKQGLINLFFVFLNASWYGVLVLYLMLFQITSIQVLFFTSLNLTHKLFPLFFF